MSTPVRTSYESDGSVEDVLATLTSPQWAQRKADELHDGSQVVRREERAGGGVLFEVSRELPSGVPGFLERFLPADGRVLQTDVWGPAQDGARQGIWTVQIPGAPASLGGVMRLEPTEVGSRYTIEGEVSVRVPLVGGRAERFIGEMVVKLAGREAELLRAH